METIFKWVVFLSSYVPVFFMIFLNHLDTFSKQSIIKCWQINSVFWIILLLMSLISMIGLAVWLILLKRASTADDTKYEIKKTRLNDAEILNFFVTFIIPIVSLNPKSWPSIVMNCILLVIEGIYIVRNNSLYFNIILLIFGYHVYTFNDDTVIVTRKGKKELQKSDSKASQFGTTNIFYV